jgi:hypothetical protein
MAQFLTHRGKIVLDQVGNGPTVLVTYRGNKKPVLVTDEDWKKHKRFQRFDATQMTRQAAYALFEAGKLK